MYEPHYEEQSSGGGFVLGLLCGAALGAAVALMFAPKTGSELRQTISDTTDDVRKKAYEAYGQATQTVNDYVAKGKDAVERGRQAFDSARETAADQGKEMYNQGRQAVNDFTSSTRSTS